MSGKSYALLIFLLMISGCSSQPVQRNQPSLSGGYYLDDGPPEVDAVDWRSVPDAVPMATTINPRRNRPYTALGKRYFPMEKLVQYLKRGEASWYGRRYHGRATSSGEIYDMYKMSAAHTTLPIPSYARVTRVSDGRSVVVKINDRGPFLGGRIIDLSYVAARKLGIVSDGTAEVWVESIIPDQSEAFGTSEKQQNTRPNSNEDILGESSGFYLQLAAFTDRANAEKMITSLELPATISLPRIVNRENSAYLVWLGPYSTRSEADSVRDTLQRLKVNSFVVSLP